MSFEFLGLSEEVLSAVKDAGYETPTPIQKQTIPAALQGRDVLGIAQTGTGKTASFTLPMIDILAQGRAKARMPRSLILAPTRELAFQVAESFDKYGKNLKLTQALIIGGTSIDDQISRLDRGVDVLIATPGRLIDLFERGKILLNGVEILVIDEADRMLDMGFIPDVEKICALCTKKNQTLFFSATMPPPIEKLVKKFLNDPKKIEIERESTTATTIEQACVHLNKMEKRRGLRELLEKENVQNAIVFCNTKKEVSTIHNSLRRHKFNAGQLHGDMAQSERMEVLSKFKEGEITILVASDVAARGLDIPEVSHVFNFDVPSQSEDYVHRIGRTGRAGRLGKSFTFVERRDQKAFDAILKMTGEDMPEVVLDGLGKGKNKKSDQKEKPDTKNAPKNAQNNNNNQNNKPRPQNNDQNRPNEAKNNQDNNKPKQQPQKSYKKGRYDSQADIGEMNKGMDPIIGMGEHIPDFLKNEVVIQPMNLSDLEDDDHLDAADDNADDKNQQKGRKKQRRKPNRRNNRRQDNQDNDETQQAAKSDNQSENANDQKDQAVTNGSDDNVQTSGDGDEQKKPAKKTTRRGQNRRKPRSKSDNKDDQDKAKSNNEFSEDDASSIESPNSVEEAVAAAMGAVSSPAPTEDSEQKSEEKPKRGRKPKAASKKADSEEAGSEEKPKRKRKAPTRRKKAEDSEAGKEAGEEKPKKRGRPKKSDTPATSEEAPSNNDDA